MKKELGILLIFFVTLFLITLTNLTFFSAEDSLFANCDGKECGSFIIDNYHILCGTCPSGKTCDSSGKCTITPLNCVANCAGRICGNDGCGGSCGMCQLGQKCFVGDCIPENNTINILDCSSLGLECGGYNYDLYYVSCGSCSNGKTCNSDGKCVDSCVSKTCTDLGVNCGIWDDGCRKTIDCGDCSEGKECISGSCQEEYKVNIEEALCTGCYRNNKCYKFGYKEGDEYCSRNYKFEKKSEMESPANSMQEFVNNNITYILIGIIILIIIFGGIVIWIKSK